MRIGVVKDPDLLEMLHKQGFKDPVLVDATEFGTIAFISNSCSMCDKPWVYKILAGRRDDEEKDDVDDEELGPFYLCEEHLRHAQKEWHRPIQILLKRLDIMGEKVK